MISLFSWIKYFYNLIPLSLICTTLYSTDFNFLLGKNNTRKCNKFILRRYLSAYAHYYFLELLLNERNINEKS